MRQSPSTEWLISTRMPMLCRFLYKEEEDTCSVELAASCSRLSLADSVMKPF